MYERIINFIAQFIINRFIRHKHTESTVYNNFFSDSKNILLIYPESDTEFDSAGIVPEYLWGTKKNLTLFVPEQKVSTLNQKWKARVLTFSLKDKTRLNLPSHNLSKLLENENFDVVIDLNISDNLFFSAITNYVTSKFKIGFKKDRSDKYYNFQVPSQINAENSYRNLLNSLKMF
ncbi:MAG: hypothetical protein CVV23_13175 [Ignavibacteriae bacterium HGW-Ignavibacteriae-2]|jgi:hypothetical protein|nr:hypothetical protein [Bacteroidota bacterium]PKL87862.1 MAG: hypothetical protein CVV23_13175 [Ignavibacteriae bacterium HGW-Ignavibacteriae-2]